MNEPDGSGGSERKDAGSSPDDRTLPLPGYVDSEDLPLPDRIGPYPVAGVLGHGGMGVVYAARDPKLKRRIAIKVLPERMARNASVLARFEREAQLLAAMNHPNIATIYSLEETEAYRFITMELVPGRTLAARIADGRLPVDEVLAISRQIAHGLEAAHRKGIVHRDLKPFNIMLTPDGRVKILDFGLAEARLGEEDSKRVIAGTPGYMSPEQVRGEGVDRRADMWAFACVVYECLTGCKLIRGGSPTKRIEETLKIDVDWTQLPAETPPRLRELLSQCLEMNRDSRLGDVTFLRREIEEEIALGRMSARAARVRRRASGTLPMQLSTFIGREREIGDVVKLARRHRLLTLTGFGGCGKTRLSLEVAEHVAPSLADGVRFVELAPVAEPDRIWRALATAMDLKEETARTLDEVVVDYLAEKRLLLVLDNCEHVVSASAGVAEALLQAVPGLSILVTSREPLGARGEVVYHVPPLPVPAENTVPTKEELEAMDSVRLFVARARDASSGFALTDANGLAVATICRQLDGIPLGIELAAAKVRALTVEEIAERLHESFAVLAGARTGAVPRHHTLASLIDWSHDLLAVEEREVFRRLAVFSGGWTLEAAETVCAGGDVTDWAVLDVHARLVDKSLVIMVAAGTEGVRTRYRMLETVRDYAGRRLQEAGESDEALDRHRDYYVALAERAEPHLRAFEQATWFQRVGAEHENLRVAFETCARPGSDPGLGVRLAGALGRYWMIQGHWSEGRAICTRALERAGRLEPSVAVAKTLNTAGNLAFHQSDYAEAQRCHRRALKIRRRLSDEPGQANSLNNLGEVARMRGEFRRACVLYDAALAIQETIGDAWGAAVSYNNMGEVSQAFGDYARARAHHDKALALWPEVGDRWGVAWSLSNLGFVATKQGNLTEARAFYERSLAASREISDQFGVALSLCALGTVAERQRDFANAVEYQRESLTIRQRLGDRKGIAESLEAFASVAMSQDAPEKAVRLLGAARALRERIRAPLPRDQREELEPREAALRRTLGESSFRAELDRGRAIFLDDAVSSALSTDRV